MLDLMFIYLFSDVMACGSIKKSMSIFHIKFKNVKNPASVRNAHFTAFSTQHGRIQVYWKGLKCIACQPLQRNTLLDTILS